LSFTRAQALNFHGGGGGGGCGGSLCGTHSAASALVGAHDKLGL